MEVSTSVFEVPPVCGPGGELLNLGKLDIHVNQSDQGGMLNVRGAAVQLWRTSFRE